MAQCFSSGRAQKEVAMQAEQTEVRLPVAIGRFYPQNKDQLEEIVPAYLARAPQKKSALKPWAYVLPHAGYVYCADVIAAALAGQKLPDTLIILCPNHTGRGAPFGVWPKGVWRMPLGDYPIAEDIVDRLTAGGLFTKDRLSHLGEHSIEVLLPFLYYAAGRLPRLVPICVGTRNPNALRAAGQALSALLGELSALGREVGLIVSSDMNHYESHEICMQKDGVALERISACDPDGLLEVCERDNITMCGASPCAMVLHAARELGKFSSDLVAHTSSALASGNYRQTVGYAGLRFYLKSA